jgi:hypothetical protein
MLQRNYDATLAEITEMVALAEAVNGVAARNFLPVLRSPIRNSQAQSLLTKRS